jgi:hypothetical protein
MNENINSQISCMANFESDFLNLVDKLKHHKGLVTATTVKHKNIARGKGLSQYRRNLLARAVAEGFAWSNGNDSTHNKYGIFFNSIEYSNKEYFFDRSVLTNPLMINLPPREYLDWDLSYFERTLWVQVKEEWTEIYRALCMYQNGKEITAESLYFRGDKNIGKYHLIQIKMFITMYGAIKIGWDDPALNRQAGLEPDYNKFFIRYIYNESIIDFEDITNLHKKPIQYQSTYIHLLEEKTHRDRGIYCPSQYGEKDKFNKKAYEKTVKFFEKVYEELSVRRRSMISPVTAILLCLEQSTNPQVLKAAKKWRVAVLALDRCTRSLIRPLKESKTNRRQY